MTTAEPVPAGMRLRPDPRLRRLDEGRLLVGGAPLRLVRLPPGAARTVDAWCSGGAVPDRESGQRLARRLLAAGMLHPRPDDEVTPAEVTVVVPVRDRVAELARCLEALGPHHATIVVDDGSTDPSAARRVASAAGARCVRRSSSGGPAAARNAGLAAAGTPLVAFVDSDCVPRPELLPALLRHFADPAVGAVAPRIIAYGRGRGVLASYEAARSALDMGPAEDIVRPNSRVPYVPGAALVVRREAAGAGFAEELQVGEDVDLVWRMAAAGWHVRYEPAVTVAHDHRVRPREWFGRRVAYGTSAAPLSRRHPGVLPAASMSAWSAASWLLLASGRPLSGLGVAGVTIAVLGRRLARSASDPWPLAVCMTGLGTLRAGELLGDTIRRTWWPVALPAACAVRRLRLPVAAAVLVPPLLDWARKRPCMGPVEFLFARVAGDAAYGIGVWVGSLRHRTAAPLLPKVWCRPEASPVGQHATLTERYRQAASRWGREAH